MRQSEGHSPNGSLTKHNRIKLKKANCACIQCCKKLMKCIVEICHIDNICFTVSNKYISLLLIIEKLWRRERRCELMTVLGSAAMT